MILGRISFKREIYARNLTKTCVEKYRNLIFRYFANFPRYKVLDPIRYQREEAQQSHATILDKREGTMFCSGVIFTQWPHFTRFNENICNAKYVAKLQMLLNAN